MPFEKGRGKTGGRVVGTPNRATAEFKEFWQEFFESEAYRASLKERVLAGKADHMERYAAELLYGRPRQEIGIQDDNTLRILIEPLPPRVTPPVVGAMPQSNRVLIEDQTDGASQEQDNRVR